MVLEVGVAVDMSLPPLRNGDPYDFLINRLMVGIDQLDEDRVRPWREAIDNDGIAAGVCRSPTRTTVSPLVSTVGHDWSSK